MINKTIFSFSDYKAYLVAVENLGQIKGFRTRLAEATGCQNAFISQVLNGEVNFNLEQAMRIAGFLSLNHDEEQFFMWMIEYRRAGTNEVKKYFHNLMHDLREKNLQIKKRLQIPQVLSADAQATYYSSWIYSAIHIAVMIPKLNTVEKIASALEIVETQVKGAVTFLVDHGLLEINGQTLSSGRVQIHLSRESANINKHHTNWRIEAIKSLDRNGKSDLHYSGVSSLSKADVEKIRAILVETVENYVRLVETSPEETLYCLDLDWFQVVKS